MADWTTNAGAAFRRAADRLGLKRKVKTTSFGQRNGRTPFNASGVVQVGAGRFVFIDNHDPSALFEFALDDEGVQVERISRRPMAGLAEGALLDPEGMTPVGREGENVLVLASSLGFLDSDSSGHHRVCDGLVRVRYTAHGDLQAEAMDGFRDWLLRHVPSLATAGRRTPDNGGLNLEGAAWDPIKHTLLFGLRGPSERGIVTVLRLRVDAGSCPWNTDELDPPSIERLRLARMNAQQGIRDISYDDQTGRLLILVGRSTSTVNEPFQLGSWDGQSDTVGLFDVKFHRSMKPGCAGCCRRIRMR